MSTIAKLGQRSVNLPKILEEYEGYLATVEENLAIKGKTLAEACVEHASWAVYYDQKRVELGSLKKYMEREVDRIRGKQWMQVTDTNSRDYSTTDKNNYINCDPAFLAMHELMLEVAELYDKFVAVSDAFKSRGYALNNITKLRVSSIENDVI